MGTVSLTYVLLLLPLTGFILGLIVGSFVNVVICRLPRSQSVVKGRSKCPDCGKRLAWYDLIPIVSFLVLKRRCRNCKVPISWTYPLIELYSGLVFLVSYQLFSPDGLVNWLFIVFVLELFLILGLIDLRHLILPDSLLIVLLGGSLSVLAISKLFDIYLGWPMSVASSFIGAAILFSVLFVMWLLSKGQWLGFGDVKLAGIIGLIFGFWGGLAILYAAVVLGALLGLVLLLTHRANLKTKLPLGTFICLSATFYILGGNVVLSRLDSIFYTIPSILK